MWIEVAFTVRGFLTGDGQLYRREGQESQSHRAYSGSGGRFR